MCEGKSYQTIRAEVSNINLICPECSNLLHFNVRVINKEVLQEVICINKVCIIFGNIYFAPFLGSLSLGKIGELK